MSKSESPFRLRFLGAAGTVTGSRYLLTNDAQNILIDCGLFQGAKELRLKNWDRFPIDPSKIQALILTHAHIDHSGYIPRLVKEGFRGKIYCTMATKALCEILLLDTAYLQEEEAEWANRHRFSKHHPALPLFTQDEAKKALQFFVPKEFNQEFSVAEDIKVTFRYAGHILGAASAVVSVNNIKIGFSGDLGRPFDQILFPPEKMPPVDYLVLESTYGDREHSEKDALKDLEELVNEAVRKNGVILIPAFAVGRAQLIMYQLSVLKKAGRIKDIPMYLNSPMAEAVAELYKEFRSLHHLDDQACEEMAGVVKYIHTPDQSKKLNEKKEPMLILSASGMATGGRIVHHLKAFVSNPTTTVLLTGFQAWGTRGRSLQDGALEIKIHGEMIPVKAAIRVLHNSSAHADSSEIIDWLIQSKIQPAKVFLTHGEPDSAAALKTKLTEKFGWNCTVPLQNQEFVLGV